MEELLEMNHKERERLNVIIPLEEGRDLCGQFQKELAKFFRELEAQIEKELYLAEGSP